MFDSYFIKYLKEDEELIRINRSVFLSRFWNFLGGFLLLVLGFFFLYPLFRQGTWGIILFFLLILSGLLLLLRGLITWSLNALVLTNKRIIDFDQKGLFHRVISEITYNDIQDVTFEIKGFWATLFNWGDIKILTAGPKVNLELKWVSEPQKLQSLIREIQSKIQNQTTKEKLSAQELISLVEKIKSELGEEEIRKLIEKKKKSK